MNEDSLAAEAVKADLTTAWLGRPYCFLPEVDSTNDWLQQRATVDPAGTPSGMLVLADYQHMGKGRQGRRWVAPPGSSLLMSILLRPDWPADHGAWLTMMAALAASEAVADVLAPVGVPAGIKWPNDIVVNDGWGWSKIGGILLEAALSDGRLTAAVVGIGLNVNISADELPHVAWPATSLQLILDRKVPRRPLLIDLLARLERLYDAAVVGQSPRPAWNARLVTLNQKVHVTSWSDSDWPALEGTAVDTDAWGRLLVRDANGRLHAVAAGDVTLRPG